MALKRFLLSLIFFIFLASNCFSQNKYDKSFYLIDIKSDFSMDPSTKHDLDSILKIYHATNNDSLKLFYLKLFSEGLQEEYLWTRYNNYLYKYTLHGKDSLYRFYNACALNNFGYESQYIKNDLETAKKFYHQSYEIFKDIRNYSGVGAEINNLAYIFQHEGNIEKAVELYTEAGNLFEKNNEALGLTSIYINLGNIYHKNDDLNKAEEFFTKALHYAQKTNQQLVIANAYYQLGAINSKKGNANTAISYFTKASVIYEKEKDFGKLALMQIGLAAVYHKQKDSVLFEKFVMDSYRNSLLSNDINIKANVLDYVSLLHLTRKDYAKALLFADSSYVYAKKLSYPELIIKAAKNLSDLYKRKGNYALAFNYLYESKSLQDSLNTDAVKKSVIKSQYQLEYNKKNIELKAEQDKKDAIRKSEKKQEQIILIVTLIGLSIIGVFAFFAFKNYLKAKKANRIINEQKENLEIKNIEISAQKDLVEEKQKEIIDSINYAKRIQTAVLTGKEVWNKVSPEHFILFKPKDIVSGDFYWAYNTPNGRAVFALADCTGHGVPGGFMSMLGNSFLNEIVVEDKVFKADAILNKLREKIIGALDQEGNSQQKDGMDMALCVWNKMDNSLEFAGANNPLWILSNNELVEYKANKMPIGSHTEHLEPFTSQIIQLQKGDCIYLITDGFADQFGGPKGKKFKYKPLMELLLKNQQHAMKKQHIILENAINDWKHGYEQIDDISLIGVRV